MIGTLGDLVEDIAVRIAGPVNLASDTNADIRRRRGGSAANTAVAVARAGQASRFIGQVGADPIGAALLGELADAGVELAVRRGGRTGAIIVLVDHFGERTMLTDRGACADLVDPDRAWLDGLAVLHVPAYSLFGGALAATAATLIEWAHDRNIVVSIDLSSVALINEVGTDVVRSLIATVRPEVLLCNEAEAAAIGGVAVVRTLASRVAVVKQGAAPALVVLPTGDACEVPVPVLDGVADTTGAGDAFAAGFLITLASGADASEAARAGHRSSRAAIIAASQLPTTSTTRTLTSRHAIDSSSSAE